jgi:DNA-directed RNA polymerase subunit RPC12/RpoP
MTNIKSSKYICSHCGKEREFTMYESVNVELNNKLKKGIV